MYELSTEDEKQIAVYCARATSKYNRTLQQGIYNLSSSDTDEAVDEDSTDTASGSLGSKDALSGSDAGPSDSADTDASDTGSIASVDDTSGTADSSQSDDAAVTDESGATLRTVSNLGDALGTSDLKFTYKGAKDVTNYSFDGYFDLSPAAGNHFLVLEFSVKNKSKEDIDLNVAAMGVSFRATVDGAANTADRTILLNDISSFNGTIKAKKKQDMIMLFQFDPQYLKDLGSIQLQVISGEEKTLVELR